MQEALSSPNTHGTETEFNLDYHCIQGVYDEMNVNDHQIRPHWEYLIRALKALGPVELERRWQEAHRLLRDNGVTYNVVYGDPQGRDRPWQLDLIPLLISSEEWAIIERGLIQRAELMNLLLADLYGARETLRKGLLPIEMIASHPSFLRPCHGIDRSSRQRLPFYAVDLVRDPRGQFWALADRTQAPSGAGYALENRLVMSRILPSLFRDSHVHRLSLFFRTLRSTLASMSGREDHRIILMTPGPYSETYFEDVYLAKYLGYTLVQGGDLTVREGRACLKTLDGLQPVDVILRRVNDDWCDPLELRPESFLGVAGLTQAFRMGHVAIANPLGTGVLENPALLAFMPTLAKHFLGEELLLPSPMTWWCGQRQSRDYVLEHLDQLVIKPIVPVPGQTSIRGFLLNYQEREQLRSQILAQPHRFVGTEEISRSTTPILINGHLEPRQLILRSFLVSGEESYRVMPGGLTRVSSSADSFVISSQNAGLTKDTWVLASEPTRQLTLVPQVKQPIVAFEGQRELPSRVAENLFWLGRYAERAEDTIRLLRTVLLYLAEPDDFPDPQNIVCLHTLLRAVTELTETYPGFIGEEGEEHLAAPENELLSLFLDKNRLGSLSSTLQSLLNSASSIRDRVSPDMWRVITDIDGQLQLLQQEKSLPVSDMLSEMDHLITALAAFTGLGIECMNHEQGWHFLMIGRRLERAYHTIQLLKALLSTVHVNETVLLEHLLNITDCLISYRRRYRSQPQAEAVLELILQNESNPRAVGYQLESLQRHIRKLPRHTPPYRSIEERLILEPLTQLRLAEIEQLIEVSKDNTRTELNESLVSLGGLLQNLSEALTNRYFSHADQPRQLV